MKRPEATQVARDGMFPDGKWAQALPTIAEYLSSEAWDDGSSRERSSLSIKVQDGCILAVLQDHEFGRGLYVVGATVDAALKSLEKALQSPSADWRVWKSAKKKK